MGVIGAAALLPEMLSRGSSLGYPPPGSIITLHSIAVFEDSLSPVTCRIETWKL